MYYLSDMSRVGCMFVMRDLVGGNEKKMIVTGDLFVGDRTYTGKAVIYQNGRSAKLIDVLGEDPADAKKNLQEVVSFMNARFAEDTNGIASDALSRIRCNVFWVIAMIVTVGSAFFAAINYFLGKSEYLSILLIFLVLSAICVFFKPRRLKHIY